MTFAVNRITARVWPYDENRKYRYQPKKIKSHTAEKMQQEVSGGFFHYVNIEA